ncbi:hypothetical protein JAAARDRAFT_292015 [Jaapia argillacea MUCL 33604]|uniref:Uncharacterized protein n=1 Tax=Jaapia argillacea MUCL 33604 TaxID=933084 RepID=A0A067Q403_9AGAM|nr:hypothetical protein JAAARDRAFT_292015 [Jaapia argillacea MUCL 33604]
MIMWFFPCPKISLPTMPDSGFYYIRNTKNGTIGLDGKSADDSRAIVASSDEAIFNVVRVPDNDGDDVYLISVIGTTGGGLLPKQRYTTVETKDSKDWVLADIAQGVAQTEW